MCFSAQADLVGGIVIGAIGIDVARHVHRRHDHLGLALLPFLFALHQLDEAFVWWGLQGHVPREVGRVATWIYLVFAFVVLPLFVPLAILVVEPTRRRRLMMAPFVIVGGLVAAALLVAIVRGPIDARLEHLHIAYSTHITAGTLVVSLYVVATCGSLVFSGYRHVALFGLVNLIAVAVLVRLTVDGFASLWCGWAAVTSGAIALHMRLARPHRAQPYVLS